MIYISKELYLYISYLKKKELKTATGKLYVQNVQNDGGGFLSIIGGLRGNYISADAPAERARVKIDGNKVTYEINYNKKLNFHF